jgi:hypothetical protein
VKFLACFILLFSAAVHASSEGLSEEQLETIEKLESYFSQIDGVWEGEIRAFELNGAYPETPFQSKIRILISGNKVQLLKLKDSKWFHLPYDYKIIKYKTNALIYTNASDIAWVESVSILATLNNINEMNILWQRQVNNYAAKPGTVDARGFFQHHAVFKRIDA